MAISKSRKKEIADCVGEVASRIRKYTELTFNQEEYHKPGRSGGHGRKFMLIAKGIRAVRDSELELNRTGCFGNDEEKRMVIDELRTRADRFVKQGRAINHK